MGLPGFKRVSSSNFSILFILTSSPSVFFTFWIPVCIPGVCTIALLALARRARGAGSIGKTGHECYDGFVGPNDCLRLSRLCVYPGLNTVLFGGCVEKPFLYIIKGHREVRGIEIFLVGDLVPYILSVLTLRWELWLCVSHAICFLSPEVPSTSGVG